MKTSPYQIAAFTHAARERSFSRAATALGVTQSSITQHVAKLERLMGVKLFLRRREGLELTRAGRELFAVSDRLRNLEQQIEERIGDYGTLTAGHLRIIANAPRPTLPVIARFAAAYPQVEIEFTLCSRTEAMRQIDEREVDIAVIVSPDPHDGLYIREIGSTRYKAFVRRDHHLAGRSRLSLRDLADETIVLPEDGSLTQQVVRDRFAGLGLRITRLIKTTTFPVVTEAVLHGVGVGFMLEDGQHIFDNMVSLDVDEMADRYPVCLVTPAEKQDLRQIKSFCDVLLDAA